ncbi:unnamed protein product [Orchesella dallaii]|uniref:Uncharacterized protein n=1 Tax=Orchesella dallaii TaxID=48710 RepID=A0ABP1S7C5_9HEXA
MGIINNWYVGHFMVIYSKFAFLTYIVFHLYYVFFRIETTTGWYSSLLCYLGAGVLHIFFEEMIDTPLDLYYYLVDEQGIEESDAVELLEFHLTSAFLFQVCLILCAGFIWIILWDAVVISLVIAILFLLSMECSYFEFT